MGMSSKGPASASGRKVSVLAPARMGVVRDWVYLQACKRSGDTLRLSSGVPNLVNRLFLMICLETHDLLGEMHETTAENNTYTTLFRMLFVVEPNAKEDRDFGQRGQDLEVKEW